MEEKKPANDGKPVEQILASKAQDLLTMPESHFGDEEKADGWGELGYQYALDGVTWKVALREACPTTDEDTKSFLAGHRRGRHDLPLYNLRKKIVELVSSGGKIGIAAFGFGLGAMLGYRWFVRRK